jgi:S1-C subfamily serine protease
METRAAVALWLFAARGLVAAVHARDADFVRERSLAVLLRILAASGVLLFSCVVPPAAAADRPCDKPFTEVFRTVAPSVPRILSVAIDPFSAVNRTQIRMGSGVVIDDRANVITNAHVVHAAGTIIIQTGDNDMQEAQIVGLDAISDLAIVRPIQPGSRLPKAPLGRSNKLQIGEELLAIGYPLGMGITATKGILSGAERALPLSPMSWLTPFMQTDAALNPGNSGGPLVDRCGEVVGISTLSSGQKAQNLNFAVPIDTARDIISQLLEHGRVIRAWHGINGKLVPAILQLALGVQPGFLIETIEPGSPAEKLGLRGGSLPLVFGTQEVLLGGDVITKVNGEALSSMDAVTRIARSLKVGDKLTLEYWRAGQLKTATVVLPERPMLPGDFRRFEMERQAQ